MSTDIAGSAEGLETVRLDIRRLEDADFRTNEAFISQKILRVTDSQGFRHQYFRAPPNVYLFFFVIYF